MIEPETMEAKNAEMVRSLGLLRQFVSDEIGRLEKKKEELSKAIETLEKRT